MGRGRKGPSCRSPRETSVSASAADLALMAIPQPTGPAQACASLTCLSCRLRAASPDSSMSVFRPYRFRSYPLCSRLAHISRDSRLRVSITGVTGDARRLGHARALVVPFTGDIETTRTHILDKRWQEIELDEIRKTPGLLLIQECFDTFDPRCHSWMYFY